MAKDIFYFDNHVNNDNINARVYSWEDTNNELFKGFMLNDSLQAKISNDWGKQGGYVSQIREQSKNIIQNAANDLKSINQITGGYIGEKTNTTDYLNSKYVNSSDYYKSYHNTEVSYPGLEVTWYLITDSSKRRKTITSELSSVLGKFLGKFEKTNDVAGGLSGRLIAPNGFTQPLAFDSTITGSFIIKTKASCWTNLLCSEVVYSISPQRTQNNQPLYIIATFKFISGSLLTLKDLTDFHIK
jgi:hypothetical protein